MSFHQETDPQPSDRTFDQATEDAQRDFAWLFREHEIHWEMDIFTGRPRYACSCNNRAVNKNGLDDHIRGIVLVARVPPRSSKK